MASSQLVNISSCTTSSSSEEEKRLLFRRKWVGFVSAIWLMVFSASYAFSNYSQALKDVLGINQESLNGLSISRDLGDAWGGILAGCLSNYLPPGALLCFSAICAVSGFGVQWLVVSQTIDPLPYWIMALASMIGGTVIAWMNTAVFNASVRNFKRNSGPVAGLLKALMGLSGAVFATICSALFASSGSMFLLMMVILPPTFCIISAIFFRPVRSASTHEEEQTEHKSLAVFNAIACLLAIYLTIVNFLPDSLNSIPPYQSVILLVMMAIIASPGLVPLIFYMRMKKSKISGQVGNGHTAVNGNDVERGSSTKSEKSKTNGVTINVEKDGLDKPLLENGTSLMRSNGKLAKGIWCGNVQSPSLSWIAQGIGEETSTLSLFKKWHSFALFIALVCGCGCGVSFSNNLGQIGQSLGFDSVSILVSLFSLGNFVGRLASGNISEYFIRVAGLPRPVWLGVAKVPMIVVFLWLTTGSQASLYVGSLVIGISHGCLITLSIPIVSEFYGLKHFGTNFVIIGLYFITGSYSFSSIAGWFYDQQLAVQDDSGSLTCYGSSCYGITFFIFASCLAVGLAFDALLSLASKEVYRNIKAERARLVE
ncbi:hypothetical protein L7F22_009933 [Adiantum nelumboides]|nr:hypothetical protein [Adiantum nelumboides]